MVTAILLCVVVSKVKAQSSFTVNEYAIDLKNYPVYTESQIQSAIASVKSSEFFDYHYVNSGCNYKSHYISLWLKKKLNIETFKVWNFSKGVFYYSGYGTQLSIKDPLGISGNDRIFWGFHVAVGVLVSKTEKKITKIDTLVIDLGTDEYNPIPIKYWLSSQNQTNAYYTFTNRKFCGFETIVPAITINNVIQRYNLSNDIFSGKFYDDSEILKKDGAMSRALATDIIVMKYYKEVVMDDSVVKQGLNERNSIEQNIRQKKQGQESELQIQEDIRIAKKQQESVTRDRILLLTSPIADYGNIQLRDIYKNQFPHLTAKIQQHLDDLTK